MLHTIPVGLGPHSIAISPDGAQLAVTNTDSNEVSIIDTATDRGAPVAHRHHPRDVAWSADQRFLYTANADGTVNGQPAAEEVETRFEPPEPRIR